MNPRQTLRLGIPVLATAIVNALCGVSLAADDRNNPPAVNGGPMYSVIHLQVPNSSGAQEAPASMLNNRGEVVGGLTSIDAFLWLPAPAYGFGAGLNELVVLGETDNTLAWGINNFGEIVGDVYVGSNQHAYRWANGVTTDLGAFLGQGSNTLATGINDLGQIIGGLFIPQTSGQVSPILWLPTAAYGLNMGPNFLSEQPGVDFIAFLFDINESGAIVGANDYGTYNPEPIARAFVWLPAPMYGRPQGVTEFGRGQAMAINDSGQIVGLRRLTPYERTAFLWQNGVISNLPKLQPSDETTAFDINNSGQIVGFSQARAVLWVAGQVIDLNDRITFNVELQGAYSINDLGQILCLGIVNEQWGALLTPPNVLIDCNENAIADATDIANGTSQDCNADQIPDECQLDCNNNGLHDTCEVTTGVTPDCNVNGVPDSCDIADGTSPDQCSNHIPDECDEDCNRNGTPDACEMEMGTGWDCDLNNVPDECEMEADQCANAKPACPGTSYAGTLAGATQDGAHSCSSFIGADVWYRYVPSANGVLTVSCCTSNPTADLSLHSACPASPANQLICSGAGGPCNGGYRAQLNSMVTAGTTYLIGISDFLAAGDFTLLLIGPPCQDDSQECELAAVSRGCRYFEVAASTVAPAVALLVSGDAADSRVACVSKYVQEDGTLGDSPVYQTPQQWGRVQVHGNAIIPEAAYFVQEFDGALLSPPVFVNTRRFGDVLAPWQNVTFSDIAGTVDCFRAVPTAPPLGACDMVPAMPNQVANFSDIAANVDAFRGFAFPFAAPCP